MVYSSVPVESTKGDRPVLVVGPAWIGDMVMAQSLFRLLQDRQPERPIDVVAPAWSEPLLERMPEVRRSHILKAGHGRLALRERWRLGRALRHERYGQAIVLPLSYKAALVPRFAGIPRRTGYLGEHRWGALNDIRRTPGRLTMDVQLFAALAFPFETEGPFDCPRPALQADAARAGAARERLGLAGGGPVLALCPGAEYGPAKRWPPAHFAEIARRYDERGWRVWVFGSAAERALTRVIAETAPGVDDLAGRTDLGMALDLLSIADAVVTNDSGLMHVAAALGRPLVAVYGSSDSARTPPLHDRVRALSLNLDCSPCFQRTCPLGHTDCLHKLDPDLVDDAVQEVISSRFKVQALNLELPTSNPVA